MSGHSCGLAFSDTSKLRMTKTFIKNIIKDDIRVSAKQKSVADIQDLFFREYQVDLRYHQAYRGLKHCKECIWGDNIKSYSDFLWCEEAVKRYNLGCVINFEFNVQNRQFERFFIYFEACITGFNKYCRPMLIIDATFLTGKFRGGIMIACGKTGNQEIFPVSFGIVSGENSDNWRWFLENLKGIVDVDRPLTIISDRGTELLNTVPKIFSNDFHSYCSAVTKEQFLKEVSSMVNLKLFSVIEWMNKIPLKNWSAHEFEGERFGELTSNVVESFNSFIRHEKRLKAIELIECIRARTMETMWKRKLAASN
ncbi:uncharacterized protein LOC113324705 [Papaver somniferum]|uniref:uncharacterized protein LOC113324705 n=1 Tax=Papaver somniferum TaxID=3469 RepID=UPI000E6FB3F1|nr:uncharacterized protein LOC113324705 [Papaver somniferum]